MSAILSYEIKELVKSLDLARHPEGGFFRETYRAAGGIAPEALPAAFDSRRAYSTSILYLLPEGEKSRFHRLRQDEVWHYHLGGPLRLIMLSPSGQAGEVVLGPKTASGQLLQFAVPGGVWFAATPKAGSVFSLVGCTVAPGFDFADFELASASELKKSFPQHFGLISEFCA